MSTRNSVALRVTGGELLARTLKQAGVTDIFALHGGHLEGFLFHCAQMTLNLIDCRHEASAGHAADAYARVSRELGVCVVTAGPGFTNVLSAIVNAQLDSIPTLFIVGAPPLRESETNPLQGGFDQVAMAAPGAKWSVRITNVERIPDILAMAIRKATTGRMGAVLVEVPIDVMHMDVAAEDVSAPIGLTVHPRPAPSKPELDAALDILRAAKRPVIIAGIEATRGMTDRAFTDFAEKLGVPVFVSKRAVGILPSGHPLEGHDQSNLAALTGDDRPDAVLMLGARMGLYLGGRRNGILPKEAKLIQVHSDAMELARLHEVALPIVADVGATIEALTERASGIAWPDRSAWASKVTALKQRHAALYPSKDSSNGVHPFHAAAEIARVAGPQAIYALDGGEAGHWAAIHARTDRAGHLLATGYLGCLGVSPGFAIGAQIAAPSRRVVLIAGDGGIGFHIQELDTMVRHKLPIVSIVFNNGIWGMSRNGQQMMYGANYTSITTLSGTRYAAIAEAFGCASEVVRRFDDIAPALQRALAANVPALIEIIVDPAVVNPVTVAAVGKPENDPEQILIPYYENIRRP
ncbi:MAG: putative benzaldehyde lyase [Bradyrhizobium sp.]|nr:putative benzaldehyde lyase [Bradyrhizobium sp.]